MASNQRASRNRVRNGESAVERVILAITDALCAQLEARFSHTNVIIIAGAGVFCDVGNIGLTLKDSIHPEFRMLIYGDRITVYTCGLPHRSTKIELSDPEVFDKIGLQITKWLGRGLVRTEPNQ